MIASSIIFSTLIVIGFGELIFDKGVQVLENAHLPNLFCDIVDGENTCGFGGLGGECFVDAIFNLIVHCLV